MSPSEKPRPRSILAEKAAAELEQSDGIDSDWAETLEKELGRSLERVEYKFLERLEDRWDRFQQGGGTIAEFDLVSLYPKWDVQTYDPLDLWPQAPESLQEFWGGLAVFFKKRKVKTPEFLEALPGLGEARDQFAEWERSESAASWAGSFDYMASREGAPTATPQQLRLRLGPDDGYLELGLHAELTLDEKAEAEEGAPQKWVWEKLDDADALSSFSTSHQAGLVDLDDASALLWGEFRTFWYGSATARLDLSDEAHGAAVRRLFEAESLKGRLLTYEGEPFFRSEDPLVWRCQRPSVLNGENAEKDWQIALGTSEGDSFHYSVRLLPGPEPFYLGDDALFPGPPFWGEGTTVLPRHDIPVEVLETSTGVDFLGQINAILPDELKKRVEDHDMVVTIKAEVRTNGAGTDAVFFTVEAKDKKGHRVERLIKSAWEVKKDSGVGKDGSLRRYDRTPLMRFPQIIQAFRTSWQEEAEEYRIRITKPFPSRFAAWADELPEKIVLDTDEELSSILADPVHAQIKVEVEETTDLDWFDLKVVIEIEGMDLSAKEIRELVAARGDYVRLENRGWLRLKLDADEDAKNAVRDLGVDAFDVTGKVHRMHALQLADPSAKGVIDKKAWKRIQDRVEQLQTQLKPDPPAGLAKILRPYQRDGFHFLVYLAANGFGGILADDMGLGKTLQSLAWIAWLREEAAKEIGKKGKVPPTLVVCPKSVLDVWGEEAKRFLPDLNVQMLRNREDLDMKVVEKEIDLLVINYAQLRNALEDLKDTEFLAAVLDEGQQIKNPESKAAKAALQLTTRHRLVLSGTPIENRLLDVWSLMSFAMPGVLGTKKYFRERFDRRKDPTAHLRLSSRLRPFLLRRTKSQVATDLPPRTEEEIPCEMEPAQRKMYEAELEKARGLLLTVDGAKDLASKRFNVLSSLLRLRQICCHPTLLDDGDEKAGSAKMEALFYHLDQLHEEGHKVLVFSQFTTMLDLIRERLEENERPYHLLTGKTENRREVVRAFQQDPDPTPFLLSLKAGGSGLNLTAASYVILFDPWWNPAVERQAIDRTHRIGQKRPVNAYRLVTRDSVEEKIRVLQKQKENLVGDVLSEETFAQNLQLDDLKFLLGAD